MTQFMTEVELNRKVPSIFATQGAQKVSDRYAFIPTIEVVRGLRSAGFQPVMAAQSRTRLEEKKNFTKHIMRFRHEDSRVEIGGLLPEIVLVNSHDGSSSYQLRAGIYRLVCSNGAIVGDESFCRKIHHKGDAVQKVVEAANDLIEIVPLSVKKAIDWQETIITREQQETFAEVAATLKWDESEKGLNPNKMLTVRRHEDKGQDLWTTFNVLQENLIRGGIRQGGQSKTRPVSSINENVRLNTALWMLTEKMAELVK